jgi:hypothetical protein
METALQDVIPDALKHVNTKPLFIVRLNLSGPTDLGSTPVGGRRIGVITGGRFEGDRLSGVVLDGGSDWQTLRSDGSLSLDVRLVLKTDDGALIAMTYQGIRSGAPAVLQRLADGEDVDPSSYYFRTNPLFETSDTRYAWLNRVIAIGVGHRPPTGPVYSIFEVL